LRFLWGVAPVSPGAERHLFATPQKLYNTGRVRHPATTGRGLLRTGFTASRLHGAWTGLPTFRVGNAVSISRLLLVRGVRPLGERMPGGASSQRLPCT
jgi:hypothetical protein